MEVDSITLDCPLCGQQHKYLLTIKRIVIRYAGGEYGPWYDKEFTRLFVCPTKNENYEATLVLAESREDSITSIDAVLADPHQGHA